MKIDKIRIKNFKGFADEEFVLNPHFTVFIGDNAKGKTSVLDALAVAAGCFLRGIDVAKTEARTIEKTEIRIKTIEGQPRPQIPVEIEAFGQIHNVQIDSGWKRSIEKITKKTTTTYVHAKEIADIAENMLAESRTHGKVTFPLISYHGTGRLWAEHEEKKTPYKKQGEGVEMAYLRCLSPKSSSKEFMSWYKTYEDEINKFNLESDKVFLEIFNECIISMIPDQQWDGMAYSFKDEDLIGIFSTPDGTKEKLLFSQLSDGYRNVIGMVADIAYRCINLNPHLGRMAIEQTPGIVLIDEIDLNLHPNWQKRIVGDLKRIFKGIQFVATTHSPFIVQSLTAEELINLDKDKVVGLDEDPDRYSIEDIADRAMDIENVTRSLTFQEMQKKATEYFALVRHKSDPQSIVQAKQMLDQLRIQYNTDPAYVALLASELPKI